MRYSTLATYISLMCVTFVASTPLPVVENISDNPITTSFDNKRVSPRRAPAYSGYREVAPTHQDDEYTQALHQQVEYELHEEQAARDRQAQEQARQEQEQRLRDQQAQAAHEAAITHAQNLRNIYEANKNTPQGQRLWDEYVEAAQAAVNLDS